MASRPIWRGQLRLALVSCPVALYSARHDRAAIRFNMINPATGNRIRMVSQDAETGKEIARRDTVKGYEFQKDRYVILSDEDFDKVKVESSSIMTVEKFVEASSIDPIFYDASYYLSPDGKGSEDVYAVLRQAIQKTGRVALTRVVISQRERTVAVRPMGDGLVAHTMNEQRDLNEIGSLFEGVARARVDPEMVTLAVQLVDRQTGQYDPADLEDRYETRLRAMLDAKVKGESDSLEDVPSFAESNVVDLMAALRKSLGQAPQTASPVKTPAGSTRRKKRLRRSCADNRRSSFRSPAVRNPSQRLKRSSRSRPRHRRYAYPRSGGEHLNCLSPSRNSNKRSVLNEVVPGRKRPFRYGEGGCN